MKKREKNCIVTCVYKHMTKKYEGTEDKRKKPGFAICPACGEYHPITYKN